jgi:hypothetical protein
MSEIMPFLKVVAVGVVFQATTLRKTDGEK